MTNLPSELKQMDGGIMFRRDNKKKKIIKIYMGQKIVENHDRHDKKKKIKKKEQK